MSLPTDPEALFGAEAMTDPAALKRAYARLLREHGPERDPEGFQIVRAAFEAVRARHAAAGDRPVPPAAAVDGAAPARDGAAWTAWLRSPDARDLGAVRRELAASTDEVAAWMRLFVEGALSPAEVGERALEALAARRWPALAIARAAFALEPALLRSEWGAFAGDPRARAVYGPLALARVEGLVVRAAWDDAWAFWRESGGAVIRESPAFGLTLYEVICRVQAWRLPQAELTRAREWVHDVQLPLDTDAALAFDARLRRVGDCVNAARAESLPPAVRAAAQAIAGAGGTMSDPAIVSVLLDLSAAGVDRADYDALAQEHPVVTAFLLGPLGRISGRWAAWRPGVAPTPRSDLGDAVRAVEAELAVRIARNPLPRWAPLRTRSAMLSYALLLGVGAFIAFWAAQSASWQALLFFLLYLGILFRSTQLWQPSGPVPTAEDQAWADSALRGLATAQGAWVHEVAALAAGQRWLAAAVTRSMANPRADLAALGPAHLARVMWESNAAARSEPR